MSDVRLFQICFDERQLNSVHRLLTPFDNTKNERPELREYHNFMRIFYEGHAKDVKMWGAFGPRWKSKIRYNADKIFESIENNPGKDIYLFNHCRVQGALTKNVWEQGEFHHPGITRLAKKVLFMLGMNSDCIDQIMTDSETVYSHYVIATNEFWNDYLLFLLSVKDALFNLPSEEKQIFEGSANYARDKSLNMFPFVIERMLSTYLTMNNFSVYHTPYEYEVYNEIHESSIIESLYKVNELKNAAKRTHEIFAEWNNLRIALVNRYPGLMHIDG